MTHGAKERFLGKIISIFIDKEIGDEWDDYMHRIEGEYAIIGSRSKANIEEYWLVLKDKGFKVSEIIKRGDEEWILKVRID